VLDVLRRAGYRGVPVVERDGNFCYGQDLGQVAALVGIEHASAPRLSRDALVERWRTVLRAASRYMAQIPEARLVDQLPGRPRTYLALANHLVEIGRGYMQVVRGADFDGPIAAAVPAQEAPVAELVAGIEALCGALDETPVDVTAVVATYYGQQTLHAVLERCTWHCAQHARQLMMVLEILGIEPDGALKPRDFEDLPMPEAVWDS